MSSGEDRSKRTGPTIGGMTDVIVELRDQRRKTVDLSEKLSECQKAKTASLDKLSERIDALVEGKYRQGKADLAQTMRIEQLLEDVAALKAKVFGSDASRGLNVECELTNKRVRLLERAVSSLESASTSAAASASAAANASSPSLPPASAAVELAKVDADLRKAEINARVKLWAQLIGWLVAVSLALIALLK